MSVDTRVAVPVHEAARRLSLAERTAWREIAAGRLRSFKIGRRRLVAVTELAAFVDRQDRPVRRATSPSAPRATAPAPSPVRAVKRAPAPRRAASADDGIILPFIELADGTVTTRAIQRREARALAAAQQRGSPSPREQNARTR